MAIVRTAWTDDDGSGLTGTIINNAEKTTLYNQIDTADLFVGTYVDVAFSDANFLGDGVDGNWALASGDQNTFSYILVADRLHVLLTVATSTVANTPAILQVVIPGGSPATFAAGGAFFYQDNGTAGIGRWYVDASGTVINFSKVSGAWANSTNATTIQAVMEFKV